jgi:plastocyanin
MRVGIIGAAALFLATTAVAATIPVDVGPGLNFTPANVTVAPGDTVTWTFFAMHTSTSDNPGGAEPWNSGPLSSGSFSHTFNTPGTYPYYCSIHSFPGGTFMNGVVNVEVPVVAPAITSVAPITAFSGTAVTITGTGFVSGATVTFRGVASPAVTFANATSVQAVVPNIAPGAAAIVLTNPNATSATFNGFTVTSIAIPAISREMLLLLTAILAAIAAAMIRSPR